jgi:putative restriction endonuclease
MSVRKTIKLNRVDLRYLLIDSLRQYSSNVIFIDGNNPYRFSINKKQFFILIKNLHSSGKHRNNPDESRIQISQSPNFNHALNSSTNVIVLGYFADKKVFTAWNPYILKPRINLKKTVSLYSRFSVQEKSSNKGIALYRDNSNQHIITFKPEYLGLYMENVETIHLIGEKELLDLIKESDELDVLDKDGYLEFDGQKLTITHTRYVRDPRFRKKVYDAYGHRCAMCGIQLEIVEAAHIIPHSHEKGTDEVDNGICLCSLHHSAYDKSIIYFNDKFEIKLNENKVNYLTKIGKDSGLHKLEKLNFDIIEIPQNHLFRPKIENINLANQIRGIDT